MVVRAFRFYCLFIFSGNMATVLKRRHMVPDAELFNLLKRLKSTTSSSVPPTLHRFTKNKSLESASPEYLEEKFSDVCSESLVSILEAAGKEVTTPNKRLACHFAISFANDKGAPAGDQIVDPVPSTSGEGSSGAQQVAGGDDMMNSPSSKGAKVIFDI